MNPARAIGLSIFALLPWVISGQTIVDTFEGTDISAAWTTSGFNGYSTVEANDGLYLNDRGRITSAIGFNQPNLVITGQISFTSSNDFFQVVFRSSGTYQVGGAGEANDGLKVIFGPVFGTSDDNVALLETTAPGSDSTVATGTYAPGISTATTYDFLIAASGPNIAFFINNFETPLIFAATSASYGQKVGFYNREYSGVEYAPQTAFIPMLSIVAVPEPGMSSALLGVAGLLCAWRAGRRRLAASAGRRL